MSIAAYKANSYKANQYKGMSPERLVLELLNGGLKAIERARIGLEENNPAKLGEALSKAVAIVGELQASLNMEAGGELSENLFGLYAYINRELLMANLKKETQRLDAATKVLSEIRDGWSQMLEQHRPERQERAVSNGGYV